MGRRLVTRTSIWPTSQASTRPDCGSTGRYMAEYDYISLCHPFLHAIVDLDRAMGRNDARQPGFH
jgi:hypothetical protein